MGPMNIPIIPNMKMPPRVPKKIINSCIWVVFADQNRTEKVVDATDN